MRVKHLLGVVAGAALVAALPLTALARAAPSPQTFVIGVDHADAANQQPFPPFNRLFEYTDFFARDVRVHQSDTIDFQAAPGSFQIVALAKSERVARSVYPVAFNDAEGPAAFDTAIGTGAPKVDLGPSNFSASGAYSFQCVVHDRMQGTLNVK